MYPTQSIYFEIDENGQSFNVWGNTGYGVRPSERKKGYATQIEKLLLLEAKKRNIDVVYVGVHESNVGSIKVIENCGGILEKTIRITTDPEKIRIYYIKKFLSK